MEVLRRLDAFPKTLDDFRVRTNSGGIVSLVALTLMAILFASEISYYFRVDTIDYLYVSDSAPSEKLKVSFDLTFPEISCSLLTMDVVDDIGLVQDDAVHHIYKHRLNSIGEKIGEGEKQQSLGESTRTEEEVTEMAKAVNLKLIPDSPENANGCGDCHGAAPKTQCCNTCEDVKVAYSLKGWRFKAQDVAQCAREAYLDNLRSQLAESGGCQLYGNIELARGSGHFHIAPHKSFHAKGASNGQMHLLDLLSFTFSQFNITHTINSLSFGDQFPGVLSPLDGQSRVVKDTHGMHQYYVKVVPTRYRELGKKEDIISNQYSVTEHLRHLAPGSGRGLPGVYFYYETSPVQAVFEEQRGGGGGFMRLLTNVAAIVGGTFTVMGLVDSLIQIVIKSSKQSSLSM
jgi:hypothetical protein